METSLNHHPLSNSTLLMQQLLHKVPSVPNGRREQRLPLYITILSLCAVVGLGWTNVKLRHQIEDMHQYDETLMHDLRTHLAEQQTQMQARIAELEEHLLAMQTTAKGAVEITLPDVLFAFNSAVLTPDGQQHIAAIAGVFARHPAGSTLRIEGHASYERGTNEAINIKLSTDRANSIRDALVHAGIAATAIHTEGFGSSRPIASNETAVGRQQNRRVTVIIDPPASPATPAALSS